MGVCGIIGIIFEVLGNENLILIARIASQALPLSVAVFLYSDGKAHDDRTNMNNEIWDLKRKVESLEKDLKRSKD